MVKMTKSRLSKMIVGIFIFLLFAVPVYASSTADKIKELEEEKKNTEASVKSTEERISELENSKGSLESYLGNLNTQLTEISDQLYDLEIKLMEKEEEILLTKQDLENAKAQESKQYEDMKMRIQFMYENGNSGYLVLLLSSDSISDLLNKAEYITKITEYDRKMLLKYQETKETIANVEKQLEKEEAELLALQEEVTKKQQSVNALMEDTSVEIAQYSTEIASAEEQALQYEAQLEQQENNLKDLKTQKAAEEAAAKKAAEAAAAKKAAEVAAAANATSTPNTPSGSTNENPSNEASSASDLALLAAIIQCEADGESYEGKLAVGSVIMNRVNSGYYPNSILGVLYQKSQFAPVTSGRFAIVLSRGANSTCVAAAGEVLNGNITVNTLHFRTAVPWISGIVIGNHVFY